MLTYTKCPNCSSKNSINIIYGMPSYELLQEAEQGKVKLGGCEIMIDGPEYVCNDCSHEWNKQQIIDDAYGRIVNIKASMGGFFGPSYEIDLNLKSNQIIWTGSEDEKPETITKAFDACNSVWIIEQLKMIDLLAWEGKYLEADICDGTQWSIDIETDDKIIHKYGDNKYPSGWGWFCNLIEVITGKKFS